MKTPKKTACKIDADLVTALRYAAIMRQTPAQKRKTAKLNKAIKENTAGYDREHDAFFDKKTGAWLERQCGDSECEFCANRPKKKKL